jgi:deazaflavin-dependent oxidoreductase (nitroreductase family)
MSKDPVTMTDIEATRLDWVGQHKRTYLESGGRQGHIVDLREIGGLQFTTTLLLRTTGRKSGETRVTPLIYGDLGGEVVVVASKGGADVHPAWFLNLQSTAEVAFQVATQAFRGTWREPLASEYAPIWEFMARLYPPYTAYQAGTQRKIPLVMMKVKDSIETFSA